MVRREDREYERLGGWALCRTMSTLPFNVTRQGSYPCTDFGCTRVSLLAPLQGSSGFRGVEYWKHESLQHSGDSLTGTLLSRVTAKLGLCAQLQ